MAFLKTLEVMIPHFNQSTIFYNQISGPRTLIKKCVFLNQSTEHFNFGESSNQGFNMHTGLDIVLMVAVGRAWLAAAFAALGYLRPRQTP
jgi:hypothetical protein